MSLALPWSLGILLNSISLRNCINRRVATAHKIEWVRMIIPSSDYLTKFFWTFWYNKRLIPFDDSRPCTIYHSNSDKNGLRNFFKKSLLAKTCFLQKCEPEWFNISVLHGTGTSGYTVVHDHTSFLQISETMGKAKIFINFVLLREKPFSKKSFKVVSKETTAF